MVTNFIEDSKKIPPLEAIPHTLLAGLDDVTYDWMFSMRIMSERNKRIKRDENFSLDLLPIDVMSALDKFFPPNLDPERETPKSLERSKLYAKNRPLVEALVNEFFPEKFPGMWENHIVLFVNAIRQANNRLPPDPSSLPKSA